MLTRLYETIHPGPSLRTRAHYRSRVLVVRTKSARANDARFAHTDSRSGDSGVDGRSYGGDSVNLSAVGDSHRYDANSATGIQEGRRKSRPGDCRSHRF